MDIIEHNRVYFVIKKQYSCNSVLQWRPIRPKRTKKCVYGDEMFLFSMLLKHPPPVNRVLSDFTVSAQDIFTFRRLSVFTVTFTRILQDETFCTVLLTSRVVLVHSLQPKGPEFEST